MFHSRGPRVPVALAALAAAASLAIAAGPAVADHGHGGDHHAPKVFGPEAEPYGRSYSEWAATWWTWALARPVARSPIADTTGAFCADGQHGHIWFLAGSFGQTVTRRCTIPPGRALVFPIVNSAWIGFNDPPEMQTEAFIRSQATRASTATDLMASIDGDRVRDLHRYFERSTIFESVVPADNPFELPGGFVTGPNVDSGYYLVVRPLKQGRHTIRFSAKMPPRGSSLAFALDVTYHLTVAPGGHGHD